MKTVKIKALNQPNLILPKQAKAFDAGYDVVATSEPRIVGNKLHGYGENVYENIRYIEYGTGLFLEPDFPYFVLGMPRSSIRKYDLAIGNTPFTCDFGYRGEIMISFKYIPQPRDLIIEVEDSVDWHGDTKHSSSCVGVRVNLDSIYKKGDRICQIRPVENIEIEWEIVDSLGDSERNDGGHGSSGN